MLQWLYTYVASVYPQCFICFLYTYVASVADACLKCFICLLLYVASVAFRCFKSRSGCCICCNSCTRMLQVFIPNVLSIFCTHIFQVFQTHVSSVSSVFFCMLQVLYLDVSKTDRDITHVAMVFQLYVPNISYVLDIHCKGFIWML